MEKRQISNDEFIGKLDASFDMLDTLRAEELNRSKLFQTVKNRVLTREQSRLSAKLGQDHPRVKQMASRLAYREKMIVDLEEEVAKAQIQAPAFEADQWLVHGVVLDKNRKGKSGLTVGIFDAKGKWRQDFGYACTDARGYFAIIHTPKASGQMEMKALPQYYLYALDQDQRILLKDSTPLPLEAGYVYYRRLLLADSAGVCQAPPTDYAEGTTAPPDLWIVRGRVVNESGNGIDGLNVTVFDKDLFFDDRLGSVKTMNGGHYELRYRTEDFRDLIEARPDLYVQVIDKEGRKLCPQPTKIRFEAGRREIVNLKIKMKASGN
jgi:hypothetical protein